MSDEHDADYLIVGAGAAGMAFADALLSHSDATITIVDRERRREEPPLSIHFWERNQDFLTAFLTTMMGDRARAEHPALTSWMKATRLNPVSGLSAYREQADVKATRESIKRFGLPAAMNLQTLLS